MKKSKIIIMLSSVLILAVSTYIVINYWDNIQDLFEGQSDLPKVSNQNNKNTSNKAMTGNKSQPERKNKVILRPFTVQKKVAEIIGLKTAMVKQRSDNVKLNFTGKLAYNKDTLSFVTSKQQGIVREVYKTIGESVTKGEKLLRMESYQLGKAQQDYLNSLALLHEAEKNFHRVKILYYKRIISEDKYLKEIANHRIHQNHVLNAENELNLLGYIDIDELRVTKRINPYVTMESPVTGIIIDRFANVGQMITPMKPSYKVADLSSLWLFMDIFEKDFRNFHKNKIVYFKPVSYPEQTFTGYIDYLNSEVTGASRTIKIRAVVENPYGRLLPNMYVKGWVDIKSFEKRLMVPSSAVIDTGKRQIVFVSIGKDKYEPRIITLGNRIGDYEVVYTGLKENESVVVSANFLLDSESQARGYIRDLQTEDSKDNNN